MGIIELTVSVPHFPFPKTPQLSFSCTSDNPQKEKRRAGPIYIGNDYGFGRLLHKIKRLLDTPKLYLSWAQPKESPHPQPFKKDEGS